jgi:hypothetical protein
VRFAGRAVNTLSSEGMRCPEENIRRCKGSFHLPIIFDLGATFIFGITGALAALQRGYDFIRLFALAFSSGVGGGLLRDGLFIQRRLPPIND